MLEDKSSLHIHNQMIVLDPANRTMMTVKGANLQTSRVPKQTLCKLKSVKCSYGKNVIE